MVIALEGFELFDESITTCNAPTTTVDVMKAHTTPNARAKPKVASGGNGDIILAKNAATVVITANDRGTESLAQARSHDSAGSE
jgi:hypothetical protein